MVSVRKIRSFCIRTALLCCLVYFSETSSNLMIWNPGSNDLSLPPRSPSLEKETLVSSPYTKFLEKFFSEVGLVRSKKSKSEFSVHTQQNLIQGKDGQKRSDTEEDTCYMLPAAYSKIQRVIGMVTDLRGRIERDTRSSSLSRRLVPNCYNESLTTIGGMISSRMTQYLSMFPWFEIIYPSYSDVISLAWTANSTFATIKTRLAEMQQNCPCDFSNIANSTFITTSCMLPTPVPGEPNMNALVITSLNELDFILRSIDHHTSRMDYSSQRKVPLC
ncbi:hypothetical protein HOLleu_34051 [Holothuria leucospilota]|uniref:Uncharacterized protein n=1 Tax=Holothuria leucospilota TaxID=206669 RepID=A0A9Q0YPQ3_HOLLE|nr:hypothetical protein HOLleu_34051 [Holothuria leucospilota]